MKDHLDEPLSALGEQRRERMLQDLSAAMRRLHRSRRIRRRMTAGACLLGLMVSIAWVAAEAGRKEGSTTLTAGDGREELPPSKDASNVLDLGADGPDIVIVRTDETVLDRYAARGADPAVEVTRVNDDELLRDLDETGKSCGIIRINNRVMLTQRPANPDV